MNPIRRELLNGLLVLVVASLMSVAFSAFQVSFNALLWVLILIGIAIAVSGYVIFEIALRNMVSAEDRELRFMASTEDREKEWLKRVGTPARLAMNAAPEDAIAEAVKDITPGSDYTAMYYVSPEGTGFVLSQGAARAALYNSILEQLKRGTIREYKRILCFDHDVLANDHELKTGVLRVGEGPGTIDRKMGEHGRVMMETKGCSLYVAPALLRQIIALYGVDKVSITVETTERDTGRRVSGAVIFFCDPPNGEIVEQFRQMERDTERRIVAVHKIVFPEDAATMAQTPSR
jgi:hypothetical protein